MPSEKRPNHLIAEKSPYLQQHAYNPVDWYPWSEEAFAKARNEDKPIFLSVGYSTCHWCHVMERESFENDAIADVLNRNFVSIKVDREERPDVDKVYMTALQAMGQNGGWPMSMFMTPELKPFYGGTYFPPDTRYGRPGFPDILARIHEVWRNERHKVGESAETIAAFLKDAAQAAVPSGTPGRETLELCFQQLRKTFDRTFGGFGDGPKFPRPVVFGFLLRYQSNTGEAEALEMVERTLQKMSVGGIYDHIGGGFHRYAVDGEWRVPHFEKMLYDQAQLASAYVDLYQVTHDAYYATMAREILDYVIRDMRDTKGGFYSAEDADSARPENPREEGEGAFYLWTKQEIVDALGTQAETNDADIFCSYYGVETSGNAPVDPQHEFTGRNILYVARSVGQIAGQYRLSEDAVRFSLLRARKKLFDLRSHRPRPFRDDKILTSWNGLMISACARASAALDERRYLEAASQSAGFVLAHLLDEGTGTLKRRHRDGEAALAGQLDDYAFFVQGLIDLYEMSGEFQWLRRALELMEKQLQLFWDPGSGGFFESSGADPSILVRLKEQYDGAEPTGNAVSAMNLLRLSEMSGRKEWREKAEMTLALFSSTLRKQPVVMPQMASALHYAFSTPKQIVLAGSRDDPALRALLLEVHSQYLPDKIVLFADGAEGQRELSRYLPFITGVSPIDGKPAAYVCEHYACQLPTVEIPVLKELLGKKRGTASGMPS